MLALYKGNTVEHVIGFTRFREENPFIKLTVEREAVRRFDRTTSRAFHQSGGIKRTSPLSRQSEKQILRKVFPRSLARLCVIAGSR